MARKKLKRESVVDQETPAEREDRRHHYMYRTLMYDAIPTIIDCVAGYRAGFERYITRNGNRYDNGLRDFQ